MLIPTGHRSFLNDQTGTPARVMGAGAMPVNYRDDNQQWGAIDLNWEPVNATRWRAERGVHRLVVDSDLGARYTQFDRAGGRHSIDFRPSKLVKVRKSDLQVSVIASAVPGTIKVDGSVMRVEGVFPGADGMRIELDNFNNEFALRYVFTQATRDRLATLGPWGNHWIGVATELDLSNLNLSLRDALGDLPSDSSGRIIDGYIEAHLAGERVFVLGDAYLQHQSYESPQLATPTVRVRKLIARVSGVLYLIELFDAVAAAALPSGDLWHHANFGISTGTGTGSASIEDTIGFDRATTGSPGGALDSITARLVMSTSNKNAKCALYTSNVATKLDDTEELLITNTGYDWITFVANGGYSLSAATAYTLAVWGASGTGGLTVRIEDATGEQYHLDLSRTYGAWPEPLQEDYAPLPGKAMMIYGTYTEAAGGPPLGSLASLGVGR
jgi:hypothetical protein